MDVKLTCESCGKGFYEDNRSLAGWTRIILKEKTLCPKCLDKGISKRKGVSNGDDTRAKI